MGKAAEKRESVVVGQQSSEDHPKTGSDILSFDEVMHELRFSEHLTPFRAIELLQMLPPSGVTESSAGIIRELRGPLPGDE
jgi:hypothetical protein